MADKYVNQVGVQTIRDWVKNKFALAADLVTLENKVDEIISEGGEPNVIEAVKVNGTALTPDAQKAVDVTVPTKVSDLTNDGDGTAGSEFATKSYVDQNGGKIDVIKVNGTAQTITNKEVDLTVPTKVSDITNDSNFQTDTQVDAKIASAVASVVTLKGSVATYTDLPSTGQKHGDLYDVLDTGRNYVWLVENGTGRWDDYAGTIDMSAYWTSTPGQTNTLEAMTVAEVNAILNPSA